MAALGGRPPEISYLKMTNYRTYPSHGEHLTYVAHSVAWFSVQSVLKRWDIMKQGPLSRRGTQIELLFDDIRLLRRNIPRILEPGALSILSMIQRQITSHIKYDLQLSSRRQADRFLRNRLA